MRVIIVVFILFTTVFFINIKAQNPATEVRAVWLTTNWNLDWPLSHMSIEEQKQHLTKILDKFRQLNINTVFFQSRIRGDVMYASSIEPRSPFGKSDFDYLKYVIDECHKRGIECHAWMVTFPLGTKKQVAAQGRRSLVSTHKHLCKFYDKEWYLDPGNPESRKYLLRVVKELVGKYDVDGIHFDYIRYPDKPNKFPDKDTYAKYGNGKSLNDWRRDNITSFVYEAYDAVKALKPWVQVSSSPLGKYRDLAVNGGEWTAYGSVHQDAVRWLKAGKQDALYPMMYYKDDHFYPYLDDWMDNSDGRFIVPGLGIYRMLSTEGGWSLNDITNQIVYSREKQSAGQAYFRAENIMKNIKGLEESLKMVYKYPAKLPAMTWLDNVAPNSPVEFEVFRNEHGKLCLRWKPYANDELQTYTIYCSLVEDIDVNDPENILATGVRGNYVELNMTEGDFGLYYSVSASDRYHNESVPCFPAYFVHSKKNK